MIRAFSRSSIARVVVRQVVARAALPRELEFSLRKFAARAWTEIHFRISTLVISQDRFRVVLAQVIFRPTRATVLAKN